MTLIQLRTLSPKADIHVGMNINHPTLLDFIKEYTAQHLGEYTRSLKLIEDSITSIQVQLIPVLYTCEVYNFEQTQVTLIHPRNFSEEVLKILEIDKENVFTKFNLNQFIYTVDAKPPGSFLYRCRTKDEVYDLECLLRNCDFSFCSRTVIEVPISQPIKMHLLSHRVENIVLDFFWVEPTEELGAKNMGLVDQHIAEILPHPSFDYNDLEKYGEHLKALKNSTTITFGD